MRLSLPFDVRWDARCCSLLLCLIVVVSLGLATAPLSTADQSPGESDIEIDAALANATGDKTVIVRFPEHSFDADPADDSLSAVERSDRIEEMRSHAETTQSSFVEFAAQSSHVTVERELWLVNALVVTVETDAVPLSRLGTVEAVERIHPNYEISVSRSVPDAHASPNPAGPTSGDSLTADGVSALDDLSMSANPSAGSSSLTDGVAAMSNQSDEMKFTRALSRIQVPAVWDQYGVRGAGVRVAVIDTGVAPDHPDIDISEDNWACYVDCSDNPDGPHDANGHGTHVSGTIGGGDANDANLQIGVAPDAELLHAKGMGDDGTGNLSTIMASMQWAVDNDADVLSMSLGGPDQLIDELIPPVRNAHASGTVVVAATGNAGANTSSSPANVYDAISVGSVQTEPSFPSNVTYGLADDAVSSFSGGKTINTSDWEDPPHDWPDQYVVPDVTAPGEIVWSADADLETVQECGSIDPGTTQLSCSSGTSMATPHAAGVVALMLSSTNAVITPNETRTLLKSSAIDIGAEETRQGQGRIDALSAVEATHDAHGPAYDITAFDAPSELSTETGNYTVTATINNSKNADENVTVAYNLTTNTGEETNINASELVQIPNGTAETVVFELENVTLSAGEFTHVVSIGAIERHEQLTVTDPTPATHPSGAQQSTAEAIASHEHIEDLNTKDGWNFAMLRNAAQNLAGSDNLYGEEDATFSDLRDLAQWLAG